MIDHCHSVLSPFWILIVLALVLLGLFRPSEPPAPRGRTW